MSRTYKNRKPDGADYWSRRCFGVALSPGSVSKTITKKKERTRVKRMIFNIMRKDINLFEKRFSGE